MSISYHDWMLKPNVSVIHVVSSDLSDFDRAVIAGAR